MVEYIENHLREQWLISVWVLRVCVCVCVGVDTLICVQRSEDNFLDSFLYFHLVVDWRDQRQISRPARQAFLPIYWTSVLAFTSHLEQGTWAGEVAQWLKYLQKTIDSLPKWWTLWYVNYVSSGVLKICGALNEDKLIESDFL